MYFAGDGAKRDDDGYLWLLGRVDDVMNVVGPPDQHDRGRVGARRPPVGRGGGGRRQERPDHRPGDLRVRDPARSASTPNDALAHRAARARRQGHRADRQAEVPDVHAGPAQDALGQDHAAPAPRHRRGPRARRHDHAGRRAAWSRRSARSPGPRRNDVPFDFLKRKKDEPAAAAEPVEPARRGAHGSRHRLPRGHRGVAARRPHGRRRPPLRRPQQARLGADRRRPVGAGRRLRADDRGARAAAPSTRTTSSSSSPARRRCRR